ncbi:MAG TPA: sugar transferase [Miltoncostaeaceae bacterium]|nr:sugar transferase [Miltoncostaeaceae bacterium]
MSTTSGNRILLRGPRRAGARPLAGAPWLPARVARRRRLLVPLGLDLLSAAAAAALVCLLHAVGHLPSPGAGAVFVLAALTVAVLATRGGYSRNLSRPIGRFARDYATAAAVAAVGILLVEDLASRPHHFWAMALAAAAVAALLAAGRALTAGVVGNDSTLVPAARTLIVGSGGIGRVVARRVAQRSSLRLLPVGMLDEVADKGPGDGLPILGRLDDLERVIDETDAEHVIVAFPDAGFAEQLDLIRRAEKLGLGVSIVPRLYTHVSATSRVEHLGGIPLLAIEPTRPRSFAFAVKHFLDRLAALVGLMALAPVLAATALAIRLDLGRPVLFRQLRVGRDGRVFTMVKFRSMREPRADLEESARITRLGRFLRAASIDELPQLMNVVCGDMSLVGPRPEMPSLVETYARTVDRYGERHRVKSGITGWAQVHGLGRGKGRYDLDAQAERVEWDNYYAENWSPSLDLRIVLMTVVALMRFRQR